jgi:hypothetical protein
MPWELARAHYELGRHLAGGERSPFGPKKTEHLDRAERSWKHSTAAPIRPTPTYSSNNSSPTVVLDGQEAATY